MMQYTEHIDTIVQIRRSKHSVKQRKHSLATTKAHINADNLIQVLNEWMADESGYDEATFPELKARLNQDRESISARILFYE